MDEDEAELLSLTQSLPPSSSTTAADQPPSVPIPISIPPPPIPPPIAPIPPPIAPIPPPPPSAAAAAAAAALLRSCQSPDSDRESSLPPPSANDYEISEESRLARERQEKAVQELLLKRRAYALAVPTNDSAVRARLRRLNEPVTLFGDREMERRDRLRSIMARLEAEGQLDRLLKAHDEDQSERAEAEEDETQVSYPFYTEGSKELLEARKEIARFSVARARARIGRARRRREDPDEDVEGEAKEACSAAGEFVLQCSEIGDERPLSGCSFSRDGTMLATRFSILITEQIKPIIFKSLT